jgi:hypothetical protein
MNKGSKRSRPSAKSRAKRRRLPHNSPTPVSNSSAEFKGSKKQPKLLLTRAAKKRGRKSQVRVSEICNRAYDFKLLFEQDRGRIDWALLLKANCDEDLAWALKDAYGRPRERLFYKTELLLAALADKQFPKGDRIAQEKFIAESLAAEGRVSIRRSRDLVQREMSIRKKKGKIVRREFYIACSCGYEGPAFLDACPDCGAGVSYLDFASGFALRGPN